MPVRRDPANAIRALGMDAVQQANSGHPGMPMGMADIAEALWNDFLRHNPANPNWFDRDRRTWVFAGDGEAAEAEWHDRLAATGVDSGTTEACKAREENGRGKLGSGRCRHLCSRCEF